jgi:predicted metal-binding membrane protein
MTRSATLRRTRPRPGLIQVALVAFLVLVAALAWVLTSDRMDGMDTGPGTDLGTPGWFVVSWVVMMAAMMLPSAAPTVVEVARIRSEEQRGATAVFVAGYLVSWCSAGLLAYMLVEGVRSLDVRFLAWDNAGPYIAGGIILGAALYQLTALKGMCLRHCRTPLMLVADRSPGRRDALRMGIEHGGYCIGCCWALMAALFALGVMSIGWMAFVAALIATEKLLPWRTVANRGIAVLLAALGIAVAVAPEHVPGLTIPGSGEMAQQSDDGFSA